MAQKEEFSELVPEEETGEEQAADRAQEKVKLDDQELSDQDAKAAPKVELDLDDAPFLDWEEEEQPEEVEGQGEEKEEAPAEEIKTPVWKRWWFLLGVGSLLLLVLGFGIYLWLRGESSPPPPPPPPPPKKKVEQKKPALPEQLRLSLKPFWVEYIQNGDVRYLRASFDLQFKGGKLEWELKRKIPIIRDAIYYYLKNKELTFITSKENAKALKEQILEIVNQFLSNGQVDAVLIQDYVVE